MSKTQAKKSAAKAKPSTALARRPVVAAPSSEVHLVINDPKRMLPEVLPPEHALVMNELGDDASVGSLGMTEVKLTAREEAELSRPVNLDDVLIKPDGVPYLSHPAYTKWFNAAFGRLGWALVPKARPAVTGKLVTVPYLLFVHGHAVAFAIGEQDYYPENRRQTFGDAVESTVASALRRCAKRLGVGLELWDKAFLADFMETRCVQVKVRAKDGSIDQQWRRKTDRPLPFEQGEHTPRLNQRDERPLAENKAPTPGRPERVEPGTTAVDDRITQAQRQRLATIASKAGRHDADVRLWLKKVWKVGSSKEIKKQDYNAICAALEAKGPLTLPGDGQ